MLAADAEARVHHCCFARIVSRLAQPPTLRLHVDGYLDGSRGGIPKQEAEFTLLEVRRERPHMTSGFCDRPFHLTPASANLHRAPVWYSQAACISCVLVQL